MSFSEVVYQISVEISQKSKQHYETFSDGYLNTWNENAFIVLKGAQNIHNYREYLIWIFNIYNLYYPTDMSSLYY